MKEIGFLFKAEMVRAILDDRKWVTRRLIKPRPVPEPARASWYRGNEWLWESNSGKIGIFHPQSARSPCEPGDVMWVREAWMPFDVVGHDYDKPAVVIGYKASNDIRPDGVSHEEFGASKTFPVSPEKWRDFRGEIELMEAEGDRWHPSIFMPRWASRIRRKIVLVRPERLQDMTEDEANAEGFPSHLSVQTLEPAKLDFAILWDRINPNHPWAKNPWVWRIEFERR